MSPIRNINQLSESIRLRFNKNVSVSSGGLEGQIAIYKQELENESKMLLSLLQDEIDAYYASYSPKEYRRTYQFKNSLRIEQVNTGRSGDRKKVWISTKIDFDPELATHPSIFNGEDGFVPILINNGWSWKKKTGPYRLAYYEGFNFAERAIEIFKQRSKLKPKITYSYSYNGRVLKNDLYKFEDGSYNLY